MIEKLQKGWDGKGIDERYDKFTRETMDDFFLILRDGRIAGSRRPHYFEESLAIIFEVMGILCSTGNDAGCSVPFSPRGLDYDLYLTSDEISAIIETVPRPDKEQFLIALPIFENDHLSTDNKSSSRDKIIAFRPTVLKDGEDKHLLFISASYLFQLFETIRIFEWRNKNQNMRNYKKYQCDLDNDIYNHPDDEAGNYGGIGGFMNFFDLNKRIDSSFYSQQSIWKTILMCDNCGKFYRSKKVVTLADCPVCLKTYPERAQQSIEYIGAFPFFQIVIPEFPLDGDNIQIRDD